MEHTCIQCNSSFLSNKPRSICFLCKPNPKLGPPLPIVDQYNAGASVKALSIKYGVSTDVVCYYIQNYGSPRPCTDRSPDYFPPVALDFPWFDGFLLGDGSLSLSLDNQSKNARAAFTVKYRAFADHMVSNWQRMGLKVGETREEDRHYEGYNPVHRCLCCTHVHPTLTALYRRWYPSDKKRIPHDVSLSPTTLREWYYGDGTYYKHNACPSFLMGGVTESEVDFMRAKLMDLFSSSAISKFKQEHKVLRAKNGESWTPCWALYFQQPIAPAFFSYIGPCTLSCYSYKWPSSPLLV